MIKELITMDLPIEDVYYDYKLVADSITDDNSFQEADTGILLSHLYDVVKMLEKQIPKEPVNFIEYLSCPSCDHAFYFGCIDKYCPKCGQAIKWEWNFYWG